MNKLQCGNLYNTKHDAKTIFVCISLLLEHMLLKNNEVNFSGTFRLYPALSLTL